MKNVITITAAFLLIAGTCFGQQPSTAKTTTTKASTSTHHKTSKHKSSHKSHASNQHQYDDMRAKGPVEGATMNPRSGSNTNGAGKSAKIQTTTKEQSDNLNNMDQSRN